MVDHVVGVQAVVDQVAGTQVVVDQVAGTQVVDQVAGVQAVVDQVPGTQVVVDQVTGAPVLNQVAGVQVVDQVAEAGGGSSGGGVQVVDHCWCDLYVDATYLVNEHTSGVVTLTDSRCRLRQETTTSLAKSWIRA